MAEKQPGAYEDKPGPDRPGAEGKGADTVGMNPDGKPAPDHAGQEPANSRRVNPQAHRDTHENSAYDHAERSEQVEETVNKVAEEQKRV